MSVKVSIKFDDWNDLNQWFNAICTRCAFCNRDQGKNDPCQKCKANKIYKRYCKNFHKEDEEED